MRLSRGHPRKRSSSLGYILVERPRGRWDKATHTIQALAVVETKEIRKVARVRDRRISQTSDRKRFGRFVESSEIFVVMLERFRKGELGGKKTKV